MSCVQRAGSFDWRTIGLFRESDVSDLTIAFELRVKWKFISLEKGC